MSRGDAILLAAVVAIALSIGLTALSSQAIGLDERARAIDAQLRCPTCQGLSIADSPAKSAAQMRQLVREQLAGGASDDDVRQFFVTRYGRWVLLDPPLSGPDLLLWLAPGLIVGAGSLLVVQRARRRAMAPVQRRWAARSPLSASRLPSLLLAAAMVLALAVPIAWAVGPRLAGQEVTGATAPQSAPSIAELEAFARENPNDVEAMVALADALLTVNRAGEAADRYRAALEIEPDNVPSLLGLGVILLGADRPDAAGPVFARVLALSPDQPDGLLYRAVSRLRLEGETTDEVRADIQRFLEVAPSSDPRRAMAQALLEEAPELPRETLLDASRSPSP